jgi:two-component system response regulator AlgR
MNLLIVDDEPLARARLKRLLIGKPFIAELNEAKDGDEALILIKKKQPDLVLLDVDMPGMNGLDVASELNNLPIPPAVIFITAHPEHALDALQLSAAGYLVKPVSGKSLDAVLEKVGRLNRAHVKKQQYEKLTYQLAGIVRTVDLNDVIYLTAEDKYTHVFFKLGNAIIETSLKQLEQRYPTILLRIHRNTLVNKSKIRSLHSQSTGHVIHLEGCDKQLPVSRRELKAVKASI